MRAAALLVLLTLAGPSVAGLACGLTCASHAHQQSLPAAAHGCHEDAAAPDRFIGAGTAPCHDCGGRLSTAALVPGAPPTFTVATVEPAVPDQPGSPRGLVAAGRGPNRPPAVSRHAIPLRI